MKVVFCVCLFALVKAAPTIVETVNKQDYNQPQANQPLDYNQAQAFNQPLDYNQAQAYNQPQAYQQVYNQPLDYNQLRAYNQPLVYNQPLDYQAVDLNQLRAYNQPLGYNQLDQRLNYPRGRRSNQYAVVSPCAAAAASVPYATYGHGYATPYAYPYMPGRVYRADEEQETMSFSDADQMESMPRSYEAPSGLAYGVFPNANTGGCGMPLLVSCSPNVVQGRLVKAEPHSYSTPVNYRLDHADAHPSADDAKTRLSE
ncbi:uncharacterized protein LOC121732118 [Aricia agestis]|uniref:uncharacterized protein LOC121732118 n=1 Tax=Aricia agestis TaxID=91739 RepID=UPI001C20443F|nr:uncharacterized protein LOC121732118 [Aricia agestis]